jgi:hypothetical protein
LKPFSKDTKELRKQKKKKKKGKEKYENGPGGNVSAQKQKQARGPSTLFPNRYPRIPLPLADMWAPHVIPLLPLIPLLSLSLESVTAGVTPPITPLA